MKSALPPGCYTSAGSSKDEFPLRSVCTQGYQLVRHVSFVDCPGYDILMRTAPNIEAALLLIAANESRPQTSDHLPGIEKRLKHTIIRHGERSSSKIGVQGHRRRVDLSPDILGHRVFVRGTKRTTSRHRDSSKYEEFCRIV